MWLKPPQFYLFVQFSPILVQLGERLVATLEQLGLGIHQRQHLTGSMRERSRDCDMFNMISAANAAKMSPTGNELLRVSTWKDG